MKTLFDKVWDRHVVVPETAEHPATLYIDLHLIHEVTSPQAFTVLKERGLSVRRPDRTLATIDHSTPTLLNADGSRPFVTDQAEKQVLHLVSISVFLALCNRDATAKPKLVNRQAS